MKKKLGLAALLMAVLLLVPSFAMAAPAEKPTTVVYTLQVPVVNENGANYEIPLKITLYDVYDDSDLSKLVSVQKAAEGTSFELWLNLLGVRLGSITGIDHNGNYVSIYARSTGYYKGSWYSSTPGFKSLSTRGSHTCSYGNTVTTQPSCEAGAGTSRTCIYCGHKDVKTTGSALGHEFGEYIYDNNATCLADGTKTGKCTRCGATDTVTDPGTALEHIFGEYVADNNASCTQDATETAHCTRENCDGKDVHTLEGTRLEHVSDNGTVTREATLRAAGEIECRCTNCHALLRAEAIPQLQSGIPKTGDNRTASLIFAALAVLGAAGIAGAAGYRKRSDAK